MCSESPAEAVTIEPDRARPPERAGARRHVRAVDRQRALHEVVRVSHREGGGQGSGREQCGFMCGPWILPVPKIVNTKNVIKYEWLIRKTVVVLNNNLCVISVNTKNIKN